MSHISINYRPGIRKILAESCEGIAISNNATKLINNVINATNDSLLKYVKTNKSKQSITVFDAEKAVKKIFKGRIKDFALLAGSESILKFKHGLIVYKSRLQKKKVPLINPTYIRGLKSMSKLIDPTMKMQKDAKNLLSALSEEISNVLTSRTKDFAMDKKKLNVSDVENSVRYFLTPNMAEYAVLEGKKSILRYESDGSYQEFNRQIKMKPTVKSQKKNQHTNTREKVLDKREFKQINQGFQEIESEKKMTAKERGPETEAEITECERKFG